jgi:hypothetical protein
MHCKKMAVTDMSFRQRAVIEFLLKEGNSAGVVYERLRGVYYGDVCMGASGVRRWVKHFKDENTDIVDKPSIRTQNGRHKCVITVASTVCCAYHLFGPLEDHRRGHHYENDEAVQEAVRNWLRGAGTGFTSEASLRFCNVGRNA